MRTRKIFFLACGVEAFLAALFTFLIPSEINQAFFLGRSFARWAVVLFLLAAGTFCFSGMHFLSEVRIKEDKIHGFRIAFIWMMKALLLASGIGLKYLWSTNLALFFRLGITLVWLGLVGIQGLLAVLKSRSELANKLDPDHSAQKQIWKAWASVIIIVITLALPSKTISWLDGLPWQNKMELFVCAIVLPWLLLLDYRMFARRFVLVGSVLLLGAKIILACFAPSAGLDVIVQENTKTAVISSYETGLLGGKVTSVMRSAYTDIGYFPTEHWNNRQTTASDSRSMLVRLRGFVWLEEGDQLFFYVDGLELDGSSALRLQKIDSDETVDIQLVQIGETPLFNEKISNDGWWRLEGQLLYSGEVVLIYRGEQRWVLSPRILDANGREVAAFKANTFWRIKNSQLPGIYARTGFRLLAWGLDWVLLILLGVSGLLTLRKFMFQRQISHIEIITFLAGWLGVVFLKNKELPNLYFGILLLMAAGIPILWHHIRNETINFRTVFLVILAPLLLVYFAPGYLTDANMTMFYSHGNDPLAYQDTARKIFVMKDYLLLQNPPFIYKFLFPYVVGLLHWLFGKSSSSLFILEVWCAAGIGLLIGEIVYHQKKTNLLALGTSAFFLALLVGTAFRYSFFGEGLIEPFAAFLLILTVHQACLGKLKGMFFFGILTAITRLDYGPAVFACVVFQLDVEWEGGREYWKRMLSTCLSRWKLIVGYGFALILPLLSLYMLYSTNNPDFLLSASDTHHTGIISIINGWSVLLLGGFPKDLLKRSQLDNLLLSIPLCAGTLAAILPPIMRVSVLRRSDMRFGFVIVGLFSAYIFVRPTQYAPRFSTPLLPLALLALSSLGYYLYCLLRDKRDSDISSLS